MAEPVRYMTGIFNCPPPKFLQPFCLSHCGNDFNDWCKYTLLFWTAASAIFYVERVEASVLFPLDAKFFLLKGARNITWLFPPLLPYSAVSSNDRWQIPSNSFLETCYDTRSTEQKWTVNRFRNLSEWISENVIYSGAWRGCGGVCCCWFSLLRVFWTDELSDGVWSQVADIK